jgi:hypothetical protein
MSKFMNVTTQDAYVTPASVVLPFFAEAAICETSLNGGEIDPGEGVDWGTL